MHKSSDPPFTTRSKLARNLARNLYEAVCGT